MTSLAQTRLVDLFHSNDVASSPLSGNERTGSSSVTHSPVLSQLNTKEGSRASVFLSPGQFSAPSSLMDYYPSSHSPSHPSSSPFEDFAPFDYQDGLVAPFPSRAPSPIPFEPYNGLEIFEDVFGLSGLIEEYPAHARAHEHPKEPTVLLPTGSSTFLEKLKDLATTPNDGLSNAPLSSEPSPALTDRPSTPSNTTTADSTAPSLLAKVASPGKGRGRGRGRGKGKEVPTEDPSTLLKASSITKGEPLSPPSPNTKEQKKEKPEPAHLTPNATPVQSPKNAPLSVSVHSLPPPMRLPSTLLVSEASTATATATSSPPAQQPLLETTPSINPASILAKFSQPIPDEIIEEDLSASPTTKAKKTPKVKASKTSKAAALDLAAEAAANEIVIGKKRKYTKDEASEPAAPTSPAKTLPVTLPAPSTTANPAAPLVNPQPTSKRSRLLDPAKKASHNEMEKKRRDEMRDDFEQLKFCIPFLPAEQVPKIVILTEADAFIASLMEVEKDRELRLQALRKGHEVLKARLTLLEKK